MVYAFTMSSVSQQSVCKHCKQTNHTSAEHRCPICGEIGKHGSYNCPQKPVSDTPPPYCKLCDGRTDDHTTEEHKCKRCGVRGDHNSRDCPNRNASDPAIRRVVGSEQSDQLRRPFRSYSDVAASVTLQKKCGLCDSALHRTADHICKYCKKRGHHADDDCPDDFCYICWQKAHTTSEHKCRVCREVGDHRGRNCPKAPKPSVRGVPSDSSSSID